MTHRLQDDADRFNGTLSLFVELIIMCNELQKALDKAKINKTIRIDKILNSIFKNANYNSLRSLPVEDGICRAHYGWMTLT